MKRLTLIVSLLALLVLLLSLSGTATARIWYVKPDGSGDVPTIQAGIDSAVPGDTVLLANGVYTGAGNRDIDFGHGPYGGTYITVTSESGDAAQCVINCQGSASEPHRGFLAVNGGTGSVLDGVTITGAYLDFYGGLGAGALWSRSYGRISDCVFLNNHAANNGGGLALTQAYDGTDIVGCSFVGNSSESRGGGVFFDGVGGMAGCDFEGNSAYAGGGLSCMGIGLDSIVGCIFDGNTATSSGGAISFETARSVIEGCTFSRNTAGIGGALHFNVASVRIGSCLFSSNSCPYGDGSAVYCWRCPQPEVGDSAIIYGSTFWGDSSGYGGGTIKTVESSLVLRRVILGGSQNGAAVQCSGNAPQLECCDVYGNAGGDWVGCIADQYGINGNFSSDPLFCSGAPQAFSLAGDSPCLHAPCGIVGALGAGCFGEGPCIVGATDVGNDQGRHVRLSWERSKFDAPGDTVSITGYEVYRRQDLYLLQAEGQGRCREDLRITSAFMLPGWDYVGTIPAHGESLYQYVAPTLCDSTGDGICWSAFLVRAATPDPFEFFDSYPDSGYSVDNLAPAAPGGLIMPSATSLAWNEPEEEDFDYFTVYGSDVPEFAPGATLIGYTVATTMDITDAVYAYYHLTATDFAGNQGDASSIENAYAGMRCPESIPAVFALRPNQPNPFAVRTSIAFDLPVGCRVSLKVFDAQGRQVRTLTDEVYPAGRHSVVWAGDDPAGRSLGSGIYFVRIDAGAFRAVNKVLLER